MSDDRAERQAIQTLPLLEQLQTQEPLEQTAETILPNRQRHAADERKKPGYINQSPKT